MYGSGVLRDCCGCVVLGELSGMYGGKITVLLEVVSLGSAAQHSASAARQASSLNLVWDDSIRTVTVTVLE
jgi:hypothetical protein